MRRRYGGFDVLRIGAALAVVLSHSYAVTGHARQNVAFWVGHFRVPLGSLGVGIFFIVSGFLVAGSWDRLDGARTFVRHRVARIWPALTLTVVVTVVVLGPVVTSLNPAEYFSAHLTALYLVRNVTVFAGMVQFLPGVFRDHPVPWVNGSLWTLTYEVWAYVAVMTLGLLGLLRRRWVPVVVLVALLAFVRFAVYDHVGHLPVSRLILGLNIRNAAVLGAYFFAGVALSRFTDTFPPRRLLLSGLILLVLSFVVREPTLYVVGLAGCCIGLGAFDTSFTRGVHRLGDPSYGIYIFAFPIQQLCWSGGIRTPVPMFFIVGAVVAALGYLSWHWVESPVLRRARKVGREREAPRTVAP